MNNISLSFSAGSSTVVPLFFSSVGATILAAALAIYLSFAWKRSEIDRARRLAEELGLNFELRAGGVNRTLEKLPDFFRPLIDYFSPWRISGSRGGLSAWVFPEVRRAGKSSTTYLIVQVRYRGALPFDFRAGRETFFSRMGKTLFHLSDVEIGDPVFDEAVRVKSSDAAAVASLFSRAETREALTALLAAFPEAFAGREYVQWEKAAVRASFERVPAALDALAAFASAIDSARA